jgi:hypothetical protein
MVDFKSEEILTCLCLIVVGYFLAKMFSLRCDGFSVGGQPGLDDSSCNLNKSIDCCPTCTNKHFRKYNMDNSITNSCDDINTQLKKHTIENKIDNMYWCLFR